MEANKFVDKFEFEATDVAKEIDNYVLNNAEFLNPKNIYEASQLKDDNEDLYSLIMYVYSYDIYIIKEEKDGILPFPNCTWILVHVSHLGTSLFNSTISGLLNKTIAISEMYTKRHGNSNHDHFDCMFQIAITYQLNSDKKKKLETPPGLVKCEEMLEKLVDEMNKTENFNKTLLYYNSLFELAMTKYFSSKFEKAKSMLQHYISILNKFNKLDPKLPKLVKAANENIEH